MATEPTVPGFTALTFDLARCRTDLDALEHLLASRADLSEREDVLPFFRAHPDLCLLLSTYNSNMIVPDRIAFELSLFGQFTTDLVIGDWQRKRYCFVEFEDATQSSISVRRARQTSAWSTRFLAGYSQVMDWLWLLEAMRDTEPFERQFGKRSIAMAGLLVIGRDRGITAADRLRLEWRRDNVVVGSKHIYCCTFDELAHDLRQRLDTWPITPPSG